MARFLAWHEPGYSLMPIIDSIDYSTYGGYNDLDFATLVGIHGGGYQTIAGPGGFRLGKVGPRLCLVDASGKVWLGRGLYNVKSDSQTALGGGQQTGRTIQSNIIAKYGSAGAVWENAIANRLRNYWHFNFTSYSFFYLNQRYQTGLADVVSADSSLYAMHYLAPNGGYTEPIKNVMQCIRADYPSQSAWQTRTWPDVFDPKYTTWVNYHWGTSVWLSPNTCWFVSDDGDWVSQILGQAHPNENGGGVFGVDWVPHGGLVALFSSPNLSTIRPGTSNAPTDPYNGASITWSADTVNYTKQAVIEFLKTRYANNISALNAAWGTGGYYTSFDSAGGWGIGTGLADEDGMRARTWFGSASAVIYGHPVGTNNCMDATTWGLAGETTTSSYGFGTVPKLREDLDLFLQSMVEQWARPVKEAIKARWGAGALYAGSTLGTGKLGAASRGPVLKALGLHCDLLYGGGWQPGETWSAWSTFVPNQVGRSIPIVQVMYVTATPDSSLYYTGHGGNETTQGALGTRMNNFIQACYRQQYNNGDFPVVALIRWELYDNIAEGDAYGVCSANDNPYDGRDYRTAQTDSINTAYTTRTEDRVYGDSLSGLIQGFRGMLTTTQQELGVLAPWAPTVTQTSFAANDTTVSGTGIVGATITVTVSGVVTGTTTVASNGAWSKTVNPLVLGDYVTATQTFSGNTSAATSRVYCTINLYVSYSETFSAADNNLLTQPGCSQPWGQIGGNHLRTISGIVIGADTGFGSAQMQRDVNMDDLAITGDIRLTQPTGGTSKWGLYVRLTADGQTTYGFEYSISTSNVVTPRLFRKVAGVETTLVTGSTFVGAPSGTGKLAIKGSTLTFYKSGVQQYQTTDTAIATGRRAGFFLQQEPNTTSRAQIDNVLVESIPDTPSTPTFDAYTLGDTTLSGDGTAGMTLTVYRNSVAETTTVVDSAGNWSVSFVAVQGDLVQARQYNGTYSEYGTLSIQTTPPVPTVYTGGLVGSFGSV